MVILLSLALAASLVASDVERLSGFDADWGEPRPQAAEAARGAFSGRALDIADHFLHHSDAPPRNGAYFFVLSALGDVEATLVLIRALPDPPHVETGLLDRHDGEITSLVEAILEKSDVGADPRVVRELVAAIGRARGRTGRENVVTEVIALVGKCRGAAALEALRVLAGDGDARIRSAAANALGWLEEGEGPTATAAVESLARTLGSDPSADARREAAESLGRLGTPEAIEPLRMALDREHDGRAVDAIVGSLERLGAPVTDPEACRAIVARCWEAQACRRLFERWKVTVDGAALIAAATEAPPALRALALADQTGTAGGPSIVAPSVRRPPPAPAASAGAVPLTADTRRLPAAPPVPRLDPAVSDRLLASAVDLLGRKISLSTYETAAYALWELAGQRMPTALAWTDRISDRDARYWASSFLWHRDRDGYTSYRRIREALAAILVGLVFAALLWLAPPWRRVAAIGLTCSVGWGAAAFSVAGPLSLPPWPLPFSTVRFLVAVAVGMATATALSLPRLRLPAAGVAAGLFFFVEYLLTRGAGFFPPDTQSGYAFVFEPVAGLAVAPALALVLTVAASRLAPRE